ncbi:WD40 repeat-like protein [Mycena vulgaris]|nr:WD40 repeat-like protein [Mycena vulgaris]
MATAGNEAEKLHFEMMYVKNQDLPSIEKTTKFRTIPRRLYAILSIDGCPSYEMPSLAPEAYVGRPMTFFCKTGSALEVELWAKGSKHEDLPVAHGRVQIDSHSSGSEFNVCLTPSNGSQVKKIPILIFQITASSRFTDSSNVDAMRASLDINPKVIKAFGYIGLLIEVGTAISELNPIAKAVMGLVGIASSKFEQFIARNESVLGLIEEVGRSSVLVADWDDPELDEKRPNQRRVSQALFSAIYQSLHLLWTLSADNLAERLSEKSVKAIGARRQELAALSERMKTNQQLDTQTTVFSISAKVTELYDQNIIKSLHSAKDAGPSASRACLPDTRVAIRSRIRDWALHPGSKRTLLLHGAAGKGKSAIVHTIARELQSEGLAVVPLFAFNRSVPDRSSSQLIPSWSKHLAQLNPQYLRHLRTLDSQQLESSDIRDQRDAFLVKGLASGINDGRPLIFIVDALDECPKSEAKELFDVLHDLLSGPIPPFVRFIFTYRSDEDILRTFDGLSTLNIPIDDEEGTVEDIHKFVHAQLYRNPAVADMVDDVTKAAQTLFECAAALCRELTATRRPVSTSKRTDFVRRLRDGPVMSLYDSYRAILAMYFDEGEDTELVKLFRRVMGWIFLVHTPQSRRVFRAFAVALLPEEEQSDVDHILYWLGSLLSGTSSENDPISPLHTSLRDFLVDTTKSGAFSIDLGLNSQEELSLACLRIMNTGLQFNICGLSSLFTLNSEVQELSEKVEKCISPGLRYACLATMHHLRGTLPPTSGGVTSSHAPPDVVVNEVRFFLQHQYLFWLEAHSCMQTLRDGPGTMLPIFLEWTMALEDKSLQETVQDYIKFEKRFREGYMASAAQIYISGLVFTPRNSIVGCRYRPMFCNLIGAAGALDVVWPPSETLVLQGRAMAWSVVFSPDGTHIASASVDKTIRVWDAATGQPVGEPLVGHSDSVLSVVFSPDGTHIASGSDDETIRVWDAVTGQPVGEPLAGHNGSVWSVAFSPDGTHIASGSADKMIRVWEAATGQLVGEPLAGHSHSVLSVVFSPDGTWIASGSADKTIRVWDAATGQLTAEPLAGHSRSVWSVAFSPDGAHIASGSADQTIRVWDTVTGQPVGEPLADHSGSVWSVVFSPDGTCIASGSDDETIRVWDAATRQPVGEPLAGHSSSVWSVAFSPDGMHIASGSADKTIRVWDTVMGQPIGESLAGHSGSVSSVAFSPDGTQIVSGSADKMIRVWDAATGQLVGGPLVGHNGSVWSVAFSPDGTHIASGSADKMIRVWDAATGQPIGEPLAGHSDSVLSVAFSPDGTWIASGSADKTIRVWDTVTGQPVSEPLAGHSDSVLSVVFSPDGTHIASGSVDKTIRVWDAATGQLFGEPLAGHSDSVLSVAFSPDGKCIASGSDDETIRVWDAATGQPAGEPLAGHSSSVWSVVFSPDGTHIASGSYDETIWVWDTATRAPVSEPLTGHSGSIWSVAFSPDGTRIASGSNDKTIRVCEWPTSRVQFQHGWLHLSKEDTAHMLWIPHAFRLCSFVWSPTTTVISARPKISLQFSDAAGSPDWAMIIR